MRKYNFKNPIVLVRHGQTIWNLEKRTQGRLDSPLNDEGILQANETAKKLKGYKFGLVLSSPLGRALETARIIAAEIGFDVNKIETVPELAERHLGVLQGFTKEENLKKFPQFFDADSRFIQNSDIPEAESIQNFSTRTRQITESLKILSADKNVLAVTHDGVLHAIIGHMNNMSLDEVQKFYRFGHCEPVVLR